MDVGEEGLAIARADRIFAVSVDTGRQADRERERERDRLIGLFRAQDRCGRPRRRRTRPIRQTTSGLQIASNYFNELRPATTTGKIFDHIISQGVAEREKHFARK